MDPRRLSLGEWVAVVSGLVLIVALFLPWYTKDGAHATAWQAMTVDDVLLAFAGLGVIAAALATAARPGVAVPIVYTALATFPATIALLVVLWRIADPSPPVDVGLGSGAWLGLAAALGVAAGQWTGLADEGPERRSEATARAVGDAETARAELLTLPPEMGGGS